MPGNMFVKFINGGKPAFEGESLQEDHESAKGWVEINEWDWEVEAETSFLKGTGAAVGKPTPGVFSFSHTYDKSSPVLMKTIVQGTHFDSMQLDMLKQTGKEKPEIFFQVKAKYVFISKVSSKGGEDGAVTQDIECVFKEVGFGYKMQKNDGTLDSTIRDFRWNIAEMDLEKCSLTMDLKA